MTNSSWKVGSWTTPTTTVTATPVPSEVSPESRSKISTNISAQFPSFIQENFPTFIEFVKEYYKSQELKGYCIDIIQNWGDYYNIDQYGELVTQTTLISAVTTSSTTIDVESTRDFPSEGLLLIGDEIIYYQSKGSTLFQTCSRGFNAVKAVGLQGEYNFESTTAASHEIGATVVNLNNIFPLYMLGKFKEQFLSTFPKNFATGVTESTVIKRIKDFYASKGSTRSFQFVLRSLFGVESQVSYPRDRIFKPSDAYYTSREVIRAVPVTGDPIALVGQVLYQEADATDPDVDAARIYVKGVVEVFTPQGSIFEIDVDTNNSSGTFVTPYKTVLSSDLGANLIDDVVTVDSTIGWPEQNGRFRIEDEIITYTDKTVTQFLGCSRARENTVNVAHDAGQEVFAAFKIYGNSNVDGSEIQLKVYGGTRGVILEDGGRYYLPDSKVTTPSNPGFDSLDPIYDSFIYNVRRALRGESATLGSMNADGSVKCTVVTKEKHRLVRDDVIRILNAPEDIYNNNHDVVGIVDDFTFEFNFTMMPAQGISGYEFYIAREFAYGKSDYGSINNVINKFTGDVQNTYKSTSNVIVASTGIPTHKIGPFGANDLVPGNQRYLKRIPITPSVKSTKTATPVGQVGLGVNGVPFFSYKGEGIKKYGGLLSITKVNGGEGYDITNPPTVQFEAEHKLGATYPSLARVKYNGLRYVADTAGVTSTTTHPTHNSGTVTLGTVNWTYEGESAEATVTVTGSVTAVNVTNGGTGYITQPVVSITGGGATSDNQASATAQITDGAVTGINVVQGGSGYTSIPTVTLTGGGGSGATATAICRGPVDTITITDAGSQYNYEPTIDLITGSGAVAYPSILNGKIESIIVTFGGTGYYGAPDVIITGDGVGATAFAVVDGSTNIVTSVIVTNKGAGYTAGATTVSIVYPGSGATFQTNLTELTYNEAATKAELGSPAFTERQVTDSAGGASLQGENYLIYGGEYGYMHNPKKLRFLTKDNISSALTELNPTAHSPIIGWAYDGHPIYGPYGYVDPENAAPYNAYKQIISSYRVKSSRSALLSGLSDPLGTYIEDYEYVQGLGDLDEYNGRFCVTPDFPNGVYAYFATIVGSAGEPAFPYFVGPNFYGEADAVNWNGNGLQKNFTEDAVRYREPFVGVDNIVAKRKELDNKVDFFLSMEDTTTLIVMETGENLAYLEDGIGYYSYYPNIRGGSADSLVVSATNKYSSAGIDQYLVEGGGKEYKVNDRLLFDNTGTGGDGVSGTVSTVEGVTVSSLTNAVSAYDDIYTTTINTSTNHYLLVGDQITVDVTDNANTRTLFSKIIYGKYYFKYFDLQSLKLLSAWTMSTAYNKEDLVYVDNRVYKAAATGTSDSSAGNAPTHTSGTVSDGTLTWTYVRTRTDGNLHQGGWTTNNAGSSYADGTYVNVPLRADSGSGIGGRATIVVSGGSVASVTITDAGTGYNVGDAISAADINLGNAGGSNFGITLTETQREAVCHTTLAHQVGIGDTVNISGVSPTSYNKTDYTVIRTETLRRFTIKSNFATPAAANVTNAEVYVEEPKLQLIDGHSYTFDTSDSSNAGKKLAFTFDPANTDIFTYKNITNEILDTVTSEQNSITIKITGLPGIFYYFDLQGTVSGSYFTTMNDPVIGTNVVTEKTDTTFKYITALEPEAGYTVGVSYASNSIYATGGIKTITVGDPGRNYSSLPKFSGTTRSGSGATATATISGSLSSVSITNDGSGYNSSSLPTGVVTLPDFVDLTLQNIFGSFVPNEIVISQETQGNQTARGQVISWNPVTSVLRVRPLRNNRSGAGNKGYIMFSTATASTNNVYSSDSQGSIQAISGTQAIVATSVSGGGKLSSVTVTNAGSNYRSAPSIVFDDPYYGNVATVTLTSQPAGNGTFTATTTTTGVTQSTVAPTGGSGATFTFVTDGNGRIDTVSVTGGGSTYSLGDVITFDGTKLPGGDSTEDFTITVQSLSHDDPATIATIIDASIDTVTVTNGGSGYLSAPTITVSGGNGINAVLNATIQNQSVTSIGIESAGIQYQSAPVINIEQKTGTGASILLKSSDLGKILKISGDNITYNYSHDRTLKPTLNTTYNLQLIRTQVIDYLEVVNGGDNFVSTPEIVLTGGQGSLFSLTPIIENEVIQAVTVENQGRGFTSAPTVNARVSHSFVGLQSSSTLNFPYNAKIPSGTRVNLVETTGQFPEPLSENVTYYAIAATTANGLADNQIRLATSLANANTETFISFTSAPVGDISTGQTAFTLQTTDLGDVINAFMKPATFSVGERIYQGASTSSFTAYGFVKNWDASGRVVSVEIVEGEFKIGEPVFGEETAAFGQIHTFTRADAVFDVSPISISASGWERTTGFLDLNEQRVYDSDRFQEFSYNISSSININDWKNPLKFAAHPAGFKVVGTQVLSQGVKKDYRSRSNLNLSAGNDTDWWQATTNSIGTTFNGTTFVTPKPSAKNTGKLSTISNFALANPDYTAAVPTEVSVFGRQLLDIQKILSCIVYKVDDISDRSITFDASSTSVVDVSNNRLTLTNHGLLEGQRVIYKAGGDRFQDARDLIIANIDYIVEETIGALNATYPTLNYSGATCARDTRLVIAAWANDLKYGGNYFTLAATNSYVGGVVSQGNAYIDAGNLLKDNKNLIAAEAVYQMLQDATVGIPSGYAGVPGGDQNCIDDIVDVVEAIAYNLTYGANSEVWDAANYYVNTVHLDGEETQSIWAFNKAKELAASIIINQDITITGNHGYTQVKNTGVTFDAAICATVDSAMDTLFNIVTTAISTDSLSTVTRTNPVNYIRHIAGEETETIFAFNKARDLCNLAVTNSLPAGTYTNRLPQTDLSITTDSGGCTDVKSAITTLSGIITNGIDNPSTLPVSNTGNYPNNRTGTPLGGLTHDGTYYVKYVDANTIELATTDGGNAIDITSVGTGVGHTIRMFIDGHNDTFLVRTNGIDIGTKIGKTAAKSQLLVMTNGLVTNPATYTFANNSITFITPPLSGTEVLMMYYDRQSYTSSFQLDQIGDELKAFDVANGLTPGSGYSDGTYTNIPLKNNLGSGTGATADITVTNGSVSNVVLNNAGNGYTSNDVLGISDPRVGEQLVKNFLPSTATYAPTSGEMVLTIGSGHGLSAPTTHTASTATYDPNTGLMVVTINNHGFINGDQVKFADNSITFSCAFGGATGAAAEKSYPRSTDYASDRWLQVFDVTTNTFTVQVLDTIPSTNVDPHTFVSAVSNGIKKAVSTVRIANESLQFSCPYNGGGTASYPRATDPIGTQGKMKDVPVEAVGTSTITVNALNGTTATNTDTHTWVGLSPYQFQPTNIAYTPTTGEMVITVTGHPLIKGDRIFFANNSLTFTCGLDNNATQHTYPRVGDPSEGAWHTIDAVTTDTFTVYVGVSSDTSTHTFVSATSTAVTRAVVSYGVYAYSKGADAASLMRANQGFIATTAYGRMMANNPGFSSSYQVKCIRDTKILIDAVADNVEFGGNDATYDASSFYVSTVHLADEEAESIQVFNHARDICREVMRNLTVTTNGYTVGTQIKDNTISNDSGSTSYSTACCIDTASTISTLWNIVTTAVGSGTHVWAGGTSNNAVQSGGNYVHTFVSAVANGVTSNVGNLPNPVTNVAYTPSTGNMVITSNGHGLSTSNTLTIADNALSFTCTMDGNTATKTYPRSTDPVSGQTITITNTSVNTITVNVGASPIVNHNVTDATYVPSTGVLTLTIGSGHGLTAGTSIKIAANSLTFTCARDNYATQHTYPRSTDPFYDTAINLTSVDATTITMNVGKTGDLSGITRTSASQPYFQIGVDTVTFDGIDTAFTTLSGGSTQVLPASDNFLIFLNSTFQVKGTTESYTYTGSTLTFNEPPVPGMDFYGFYLGKLTLLDEIAPFFDSSKKTFVMRQDTEPFSLESDNPNVEAQNNLLIFLNGIYQEPGVAFSLTGSIIDFSEAPRAGSTCNMFIFTGSASDVLISNTFNSVDVGDRFQIASEGSDRSVAKVSSSTTIDSYEYTGLRPTTAQFVATVVNGIVTQVTVTDPGSNYEVPPILVFTGGGGEGAFAETTIEQGSGKVTGVINLQGGTGYTSGTPVVVPTHPMALERKQRDRLISGSKNLATSYLTQTLSDSGTTINLKNVWYDTSQKNGFPDEGEVLIPFYNTTVTPPVWCCERILYGAKDTSNETLTVATGGRGYLGTTAAAHVVLTGTYSSSGTSCTVTTASNHNLSTGQRIYLDFTSGTGFDGTYIVTVTGATTFTVEFPFSRTTSGNVSLLPEVRLRSL